MLYRKYTIKTTTEAEDYVSYMLSELGITAVEIDNLLPVSDDIQGGTFEELQPDLAEDDGRSSVSFYLEDGQEDADLISNIKAGLKEAAAFLNIGEGSLIISEPMNDDYLNNWKEFFHSFSINKLFIKPTWEDAEISQDQVLIEIDPGVSFGTGKHESTYMVMDKMQDLMQDGDHVLDVGCGSGILSIAAVKLGAAYVAGTDIDPDCISSTRENMALNHIAGFGDDFFVGDLTSDAELREKIHPGTYDVVFANILADIIIGMADTLYTCPKEGGLLITSGIIDFKEEQVRDALVKAGFTILETNAMGEWRSIVARK